MTGLYLLDIASPLSYLIAVLVPALDALIPVLPSETAVIALGVATAGSADPRIGLLVALAGFGAFLGDNAAYLLGQRFGPAVDRRLFAGKRGAARRAWAQRSLGRFGTRILIVCRFIPGGRTAVTVTCGLIGYPRRRFLGATGCAGIVWASYAFFLGRVGGKAFEDRPWIGLLLALGLALVVSLLIEGARRAWQWRTSAHIRSRRRASAGHQRPARRSASPAGTASPHDLHTAVPSRLNRLLPSSALRNLGPTGRSAPGTGVVMAGGPAPVPQNQAAQSWTSGAKDLVMTALGASRVWATVSRGP